MLSIKKTKTIQVTEILKGFFCRRHNTDIQIICLHLRIKAHWEFKKTETVFTFYSEKCFPVKQIWILLRLFYTFYMYSSILYRL